MGKETGEICVASNEQLMDKVYYRRLWLAVRNFKDISRRGWLDELADAFRDYEGRLVWPEGDEYELPDIDDEFNSLDMRWLDFFIAADDTGDNPYTRCRKLQRLRLFDLYFKIKYEHIAEHFSK